MCLAKNVFLSVLFNQPVINDLQILPEGDRYNPTVRVMTQEPIEPKELFTGVDTAGASSINHRGATMVTTTLSRLDMRAVRQVIAEVSQLPEDK
ncbi:Uncharacterised protein [Providencia rettgeri]|uniref:Uncharacterized protein n=1 Tax=Providencia rettgeri TaxID=587 RepID=A0A379FTE9_PRORE|nr:Uncharacterised protein [Providencia rettgeri]